MNDELNDIFNDISKEVFGHGIVNQERKAAFLQNLYENNSKIDIQKIDDSLNKLFSLKRVLVPLESLFHVYSEFNGRLGKMNKAVGTIELENFEHFVTQVEKSLKGNLMITYFIYSMDIGVVQYCIHTSVEPISWIEGEVI